MVFPVKAALIAVCCAAVATVPFCRVSVAVVPLMLMTMPALLDIRRCEISGGSENAALGIWMISWNPSLFGLVSPVLKSDIIETPSGAATGTFVRAPFRVGGWSEELHAEYVAPKGGIVVAE